MMYLDIYWQFSEIDEDCIVSINVYVQGSNFFNIVFIMELDVMVKGWGKNVCYDFIFLLNFLYLIFVQEVEIILNEVVIVFI